MPQDTRTLSLYVGLGAIAAAVFAADLFTPLGVAVWILYILPVGLTLLGRDQSAPIVAAIGCTLLMVITAFTDTPGQHRHLGRLRQSRLFGVVTIWTMALLARSRISVRTRLEAEDWIRRTQTQLLEAMQGELSMADIGSRALKVLSSSLDAQVLALYGFDGTALRLTATHALRAGVDVPDTFETGEGVAGEAVRAGRVTVLRDIPESFLPIRSALLSGTPRHVVVSPLMSDLVPAGRARGRVRAPADRRTRSICWSGRSDCHRGRHARRPFSATGFARCSRRRSVSPRRSACSRKQLRVANEELEQHSEILKSSQVRLEQQQAELEATQRAARDAGAGARAPSACAGRRQAGGRARQSIQVRVPGQHVARAADAAEQHADSRQAAHGEPVGPAVG